MSSVDRQVRIRLGEAGPDSDLVALAQALSHPLRLAIVRVFASEPSSATRTAAALGQPVASVAYHVSVLEGLGVLELQFTQERRGCLEHVYCVTALAREQFELRRVL